MAELDAENQRIAEIGCLLVDRFREDRAPDTLQQAQDYIRLGLLDARAQLREERRRRARRPPHFTARSRRAAGVRPALQHHKRLLTSRTNTLERRRKILRAVADALAWIALSHQPAAIPRLFRPQTHDLPDQRGLIGPVLVQRAAHDSGKFLVIENDLTRCLGLGDLTVVSLEAEDVPPFSIEVKTKVAKLEEGEVAELMLALVEVDHPRAQKVLEELSALLGPAPREPEKPAVADTKQLREFFDQAARVIEAHADRSSQLGVVSGNWPAVKRVLGRALPGRPSLDIAERGVWLAAIHATNYAAEFRADLKSLRHLARTTVPDYESGRITFATTLHLEKNDFAGAMTLPVAVWRLPPLVRAKVLNGDLVLISYVDLGIFAERLAALGIEADLGEEGWTFRRDGQVNNMTKAAAARARLDIGFGGMNLESFAARIHERMAADAAEAT